MKGERRDCMGAECSERREKGLLGWLECSESQENGLIGWTERSEKQQSAVFDEMQGRSVEKC